MHFRASVRLKTARDEKNGDFGGLKWVFLAWKSGIKAPGLLSYMWKYYTMVFTRLICPLESFLIESGSKFCDFVWKMTIFCIFWPFWARNEPESRAGTTIRPAIGWKLLFLAIFGHRKHNETDWDGFSQKNVPESTQNPQIGPIQPGQPGFGPEIAIIVKILVYNPIKAPKTVFWSIKLLKKLHNICANKIKLFRSSHKLAIGVCVEFSLL